jgi:hypothetical protein
MVRLVYNSPWEKSWFHPPEDGEAVYDSPWIRIWGSSLRGWWGCVWLTMRKKLRFTILRMARLFMTHYEKGVEVHPAEDEEAGYDSPWGRSWGSSLRTARLSMTHHGEGA